MARHLLLAAWLAACLLALVGAAPAQAQPQVLRERPSEPSPQAWGAAPVPLPVRVATAVAPGPTHTAPARSPAANADSTLSESLPALLQRVLDQDPQVRVAQLLLQATEERRLQARSRLGPSVTLTSSYGRAVDADFGLQVNRRTDRHEAGLRWNLYNFGNDLAEFRGSSRDVVAAGEDLRRAREEAAERIAEAYAELLRVEQLLPRASERLDALRRLARQVQRQFELGKASDADALQAQASMLDAEIVHEQLAADLASARQRLGAVVGDAVGGAAGVAVRPVRPVDLPPAPTEAAMPRPGQVLAAQERAAAARTRVRPAASVYAPRVDLEYRQQLSDRTSPRSSTEQQHGWLLSARWDMPVGGELQARRAEVERRAEAAEAEAERVMQTVQAELLALGPRIAQAQRAVALLDKQVGQYDSLVRAGELQYEAGRRSLAQLMQLHDSRFNAEQRRAEQAHRLLGARLRQLALQGQLLTALGVPVASGR